MAPSPRRVIVRPEAFGYGFDVLLEPPLDGVKLDREFRDYGEARAYADGLAERSWRVDDRVPEEAR